MFLDVRNLSKSFEGVHAVQNCSFSVPEGKIVALIGPNGAGKTTAFNLITGLETPDSGDLHFKGTPITSLPIHARATLGIGRTFQLIRLFPKLTVLENLLLAKPKEGEKLLSSLFKRSQLRHEHKASVKRCKEFLALVGLEEKQNERARNLSYGQQKLLEMARVLATEADLLMLDEPVAGVNPKLREKIKTLLKELKKEGKTILFIEHDMKFTMELADQVIVMDSGTIIAQGTPKEIQKNKRVIEAYLGKKIHN